VGTANPRRATAPGVLFFVSEVLPRFPQRELASAALQSAYFRNSPLRWQFKPADRLRAEALGRELQLSPIAAQLLLNRGIRGIEDAAAFLKPSLEQLHSPWLMAGMRAAVERLRAAIERQEKILIYGDYDADGTTAIIVLKAAIELCGGQVGFHVPHRIREGYGMRDEILGQAAADGYRLIISVDTGIRAFAAADAAQRLALDLIITDHHLPEAAAGAEGSAHLPYAVAVLNPNQPDCSYPNKGLCGAAVAFKLAHALLEKSGRAEPALLRSFLKMVAVATIADAVPLTGENRAIAAIGLAGLRDPRNPGLRALLQAAGLDGSRRLTSGDIAFRLAPRLNAAGRMDIARDVIELFSTRDAARAQELAAKLNQLNADRQTEEQRIVAEIDEQMRDVSLEGRFSLVLAGDGWHRGVIGIAATRAVERYRRPALVIARDEAGQGHGSGRSLPALHLLEALESCRGLFTRFGGHAHAVGFSLPSERIPALAEALERFAGARLTAADLEPQLELEAQLSMAEVTPNLLQEVRRLEPFGVGNPEPRFAISGARLLAPPRVLKEKHLKLRLGSAERNGKFVAGMDALGWRLAAQFPTLAAGDVLEAAVSLDEDHHPEYSCLQLTLHDLRLAAAAPAGAART
jgi:single-stranded-DNA-specific exonuclease